VKHQEVRGIPWYAPDAVDGSSTGA
jgi:hypothetical protein